MRVDDTNVRRKVPAPGCLRSTMDGGLRKSNPSGHIMFWQLLFPKTGQTSSLNDHYISISSFFLDGKLIIPKKYILNAMDLYFIPHGALKAFQNEKKKHIYLSFGIRSLDPFSHPVQKRDRWLHPSRRTSVGWACCTLRSPLHRSGRSLPRTTAEEVVGRKTWRIIDGWKSNNQMVMIWLLSEIAIETKNHNRAAESMLRGFWPSQPWCEYHTPYTGGERERWWRATLPEPLCGWPSHLSLLTLSDHLSYSHLM